MRMIHISDLHIGKQLHGYRLLDDQAYILEQIIQKIKEMEPDVVVIAGDVYDKPVPPAEAVALFNSFLTQLSDTVTSICVVAGNHDSGARIDYGCHILERNRIYIAGEAPKNEREFLRKAVIEDEHGTVDIWLLPFVKPSYVRHFLGEEADTYENAVRLLLGREKIDTQKRNVLVAHQFFVGASGEALTSDSELLQVGGLDQISYSVAADFDYAALGHLHRKQTIGEDHIVYSGSPLQYSVSEANDKKYFVCVDMGAKGDVKITPCELVPLRKVRRMEGTIDELIAMADGCVCDDYVSLTLTDENELFRPRQRLETVYSRILELRIGQTQMEKVLHDMEQTQETGDLLPDKIFARFFEEMNGRCLTQREREIMMEVINDVNKEEDV